MLAFEILFDVLGTLCVLVGLAIAFFNGGSGDNNWFETKWGRAGGTITFIIVGALMIYTASHDPFGDEPDPSASSSASPTAEPDGGPVPPTVEPDGNSVPPTSPPPMHDDAVILTHSHNAYCATYRSTDDKMACVIRLHEKWSNAKRCPYLYVYDHGTVTHKGCPTTEDLEDLYMVPSSSENDGNTTPDARYEVVSDDEVGHTVGPVTCTVTTEKGTVCRDAAGVGFRLNRYATGPQQYP